MAFVIDDAWMRLLNFGSRHEPDAVAEISSRTTGDCIRKFIQHPQGPVFPDALNVFTDGLQTGMPSQAKLPDIGCSYLFDFRDVAREEEFLLDMDHP